MAQRLQAEQVRCFALDAPTKKVAWTVRDEPVGDGDVLLEPLAVGLDGTDEDVAKGHGEPPPGREELVLGHEALLRVVESQGALGEGELVVPTVRRGCGACGLCLRERSDACETGAYTEHGIKGLDGWLADRAWARASELVQVPPGVGLEAVLAEPLSISVKALEHARGVRRARVAEDFERGARALVVGFGSLGSTAALLLRDQGFETAVLDRSPGPESRQFCERLECELSEGPAKELGGSFDLVIETPGAMKAIAGALEAVGPNGVLVTLGVPQGSRKQEVTERMVRELVLENQSVLGSVNSTRQHLAEALQVLRRWRERDPRALDLLTEARWPPERAHEALEAGPPLKKLVVWEGA